MFKKIYYKSRSSFRVIFNLLYFLGILILVELSCRIFTYKFLAKNPPPVNNSFCWEVRWLKYFKFLKNKKIISYNFKGGISGVLPFDIYDKVKGWNVKPNVKIFNPWNGKTLNTNSKGVRGIREYSYKRKGGIGRIVLIGDSFTFGEENSDNEIVSYFLDRKLPNYEVVNLGVHGYGPDQMYLKLRDEGIKYSPDIVILLYISGDTDRNILSFRDYAKSRFILNKKGELVLTNVPVPTPYDIINKDKKRFYLWEFLKLIIFRFREIRGEVDREKIVLAVEIIKEMNRLCAENNIKFIVCSTDHDYDDVLDILIKYGIIVIELKIPDSIDKRIFAGHWLPDGHRLVSELLYKELVSRGLVNIKQQ